MVQNVLKHPNFWPTTLTMKCTVFPLSIIQGSEWLSHLRYFLLSLVSSCSTFPVSSPCRGGFCSSFFFFSAALKRPCSQQHHGTLQTTVLSLLQHSALRVRCTRMDVWHHPASGVRRKFTGRTLVIATQSSPMMKMFWSFSMQLTLMENNRSSDFPSTIRGIHRVLTSSAERRWGHLCWFLQPTAEQLPCLALSLVPSLGIFACAFPHLHNTAAGSKVEGCPLAGGSALIHRNVDQLQM